MKLKLRIRHVECGFQRPGQRWCWHWTIHDVSRIIPRGLDAGAAPTWSEALAEGLMSLRRLEVAE